MARATQLQNSTTKPKANVCAFPLAQYSTRLSPDIHHFVSVYFWREHTQSIANDHWYHSVESLPRLVVIGSVLVLHPFNRLII